MIKEEGEKKIPCFARYFYSFVRFVSANKLPKRRLRTMKYLFAATGSTETTSVKISRLCWEISLLCILWVFSCFCGIDTRRKLSSEIIYISMKLYWNVWKIAGIFLHREIQLNCKNFVASRSRRKLIPREVHWIKIQFYIWFIFTGNFVPD